MCALTPNVGLGSATNCGRIRVPLTIRWAARAKDGRHAGGGRRRGGHPTRADPALLKARARAFRYQRLLDEGRYASISEMAKAEKIERGYLGTLLRLTLLAPAILEALLYGRQPAELGLPTLMEPFPADWSEQRQALLGARAFR